MSALIAWLLKNIPTILGIIQAIAALFMGQAAFQSHQELHAAVASNALSAAAAGDQWNWLVGGQGAGSAAFVIGAITFIMGLQPMMTKIFEAHSDTERKKALQELLQKAETLVESLPASQQSHLINKFTK